jgi:hypothetical protein
VNAASPVTPSSHPPGARLRSPIALYPALLAIALVLELLNVSGVSPFATVRSLLVVVVVALLLSWLSRLLLRNVERGGVFA